MAGALLLVLVGALPFLLLGYDLIREGGHLTGAVGLFSADQLHYMGLIRDVAQGERLLDHFPVFQASGGLVALGVDPRIAFLLWIPLGAAALFLAWRLYIRRMLESPGARAGAMVLALFYATPVLVLGLAHGANRSELKLNAHFLMPAAQLWGYPHIAVALAAMGIYVLAVEALATGRRLPWRGGGRPVVWAALAGMTASWIHPWQGLTLVLITLGAAAMDRFGARWRAALVPIAATLAPLVYYGLAARLDEGFRLVQSMGKDPAPPLVVLALLAPLALLALAGVRRPRGDVAERLLLLWPLAAIAGYLWFSPGWSPSALAGTTLPLAILAMRAWDRVRHAEIATAIALLLLMVPGTAALVDAVRDVQRSSFADLVRIPSGDAAALEYIEQSTRPGRVVVAGHYGLVAWAETGRDVWAVDPSVTRAYSLRVRLANDLVHARVSSRGTQRFVRHIGAAFVVSPCGEHGADLTAKLGRELVAKRRFACATVYELRS